jgi:hypothetical protein
VSHFECPVCLGTWLPANAMRHPLDTPSQRDSAAPRVMRCLPCEVAFERALWDAFPTAPSKSAAYREAQRVAVIQRRKPVGLGVQGA